jgi:hypothetical protein
MIRRLLLSGLAPVLLGGCGATHLLYVHNTVLGVDVSASTQGTGHLTLGYDRDTYALVPRKKEGDVYDAMTLTAVNCVFADGLEKVRFNHFIATGESAKQVAKDTEGLKKIREAIYGPGEGSSCE